MTNAPDEGRTNWADRALVSSHVAEVQLDPAALWSKISRLEDYRTWWPWLRHFDARVLEQGETWRCTVKPPLPYSVDFRVHLDDVVEERFVAASVSGDISGLASLELRPAGSGTEIRLSSALVPRSSTLKLAARLGPVARFGHDWIIGSGLRQFAGLNPGPGG